MKVSYEYTPGRYERVVGILCPSWCGYFLGYDVFITYHEDGTYLTDVGIMGLHYKTIDLGSHKSLKGAKDWARRVINKDLSHAKSLR